MKRPMLALIAHDSQKNALTQLAAEEEYQLRHEYLVATKTTGEALAGAGLHLAVGTVQSGHRGGDLRSRQGLLKARSMALSFFKMS